MELRNIAIIAHVDHGKTTLVDFMLRQTGVFRSNQLLQDCVMDSNDLERERGITILAKNTSVMYKDVKINIIDTPGHHDFGGEVDRVLSMADGALLLVDAADGPMPQTRTVLRKALANNLHPIVVINKLDRPEARAHEVHEEVFYLFMELEASDEQMGFPTVYTIGREGKSKLNIDDPWTDLAPLFDTILARVPPPAARPSDPLQIGVSLIDYNDYVGRMAIGPVAAGAARVGQPVMLLKRDGRQLPGQIMKLQTFVNLKREDQEAVEAGDIVCVVGLPDVDIGDTIASAEDPHPLPPIQVDEPTLAMNFMVNDSPLAGKDGRVLTSRQLYDRLVRETYSDPALRLDRTDSTDAFRVCGRGLLHLSILMERMRREESEFQVSKPEILTKTINGKLCEPIEMASIDLPHDYVGKVIELMGQRKGMVEKLDRRRERTHLLVRVPARGLMGLHSKLLSMTRGEAVLHSAFEDFEEFRGEIPGRQAGVMMAQSAGEVTTYALDGLQSRGIFFLAPATKVYPGMIVGEHVHEKDLVVNIARTRKLTNMRAASADWTVVLPKARTFSLEEALEYITEDELVEVTPATIRLRKKILTEIDRRRLRRQDAEVEVVED